MHDLIYFLQILTTRSFLPFQVLKEKLMRSKHNEINRETGQTENDSNNGSTKMATNKWQNSLVIKCSKQKIPYILMRRLMLNVYVRIHLLFHC